MTSRSEKVRKMVERTETAGGDTPPAVPPQGDPLAEMTSALATTDRAPIDAGAAIEQLALPTVGAEPSTSTQEPPKRGGRPIVNDTPEAAARRERDARRRAAMASGSPSKPTSKGAPTGRRSLRDKLADAEAETSALRAQVAMLRPDDAAVAQAREALEGTFIIASTILTAYVHPTLDISKEAAKLAEVWSVPLAPHIGEIGESMPWIAAGLSTVVILLPVYQRYQEATSKAPNAIPADAGKVPETVGVPEVGTLNTVRTPRDGETVTVAPYVRPMGAM